MELIFVLSMVFSKIFFVNYIESYDTRREVVRALGIYTLMDDEMFTVFLTLKGMLAVRAL